MNPRFKCPTCSSVNFTYTGETERCCKLCETKWDDYGNVVHSQPVSRSEPYEDLVNLLDELAEKKEKLARSLETIEKLKNEAQMKNSPSCLNWDYSDFLAAYTDACASLNIVPKPLHVDDMSVQLERFFDLHNEWIVMTVNDALHDWIYEKLLNENKTKEH